MRNAAFVDTGAWLALADPADQYHDRATKILERLRDDGRTLVTTDFVVAETYAFIRSRVGVRAALTFTTASRSSPTTRRIAVPEDWHIAAEELLAQYEDQDLSYVDAISFVAMRRMEIRHAFAFDHHFRVLGFELLEAD